MRSAVRVALVPVGLLLLASLLPARAQEQPPIQVVRAWVEYAFGQQATFSIEVSASAGIEGLYLYLQKEGDARVEVVPVPFSESEPTVQASFQRDLRFSPFPPFGQVVWWWEVRDRAGHQQITDPLAFQYVDNRFEWQAGAAGPVRVHAVTDDPVYLRAALDIAQASLARIGQGLGGPLPEALDVYLYPSLMDLRAALEMGGREWMGGQARPELGVVLVAIPYDDEFVARMEREIPHELTHLLLYQAVGPEGYPYVPAWLNEGLATASETRPDPTLDALLEKARVEGRLIPLAELCAPFSSDPEKALLSYAISSSLVKYIQGRYGWTGIRSLLSAYADGASCEGGVVQVLGINLGQLELAWKAHLMGLSGWATWLSENKAWLFLWGLSLLLALPMAGLGRTRRKS